MTLVGELSLWAALLMSAWSVLLSFAGVRLGRADLAVCGERGIHAGFAFIGLAALALWSALLTSDFSLRYVATFTSANLPLVYRFSAFWGGRAGSMLLSCLLLAFVSVLATWHNRSRNRALMPWVTGTGATALLVVVAATALAANPFERLEWIPADGRGLDPLLQDPAIAIHAPLLQLGFVATTIPFGFAIGALATGALRTGALAAGALATRRLEADWLAAVRQWTFVSWVLLTVGMVLRMWWAYRVPEAGGNWIWEPAENAALLPWLSETALLHALVVQEKRGMLRRWTVTLVVLTFLLALFGTLIARSSAIPSVRSFVQGAVGTWSLVTLGSALAVSLLLIGSRRLAPTETGPGMAVAGPARRDCRRVGGSIVHAGIVVLVAALAGAFFKRGYDVQLGDGESFRAKDAYGREWTLTNDGVSKYRSLNREIVAVAIRPSLDGRPLRILASERRQQVDARGEPSFEPSTAVGILSSLRQDVTLELVEASGDRARIRIGFNPLAVWLWYGGAMMVIGGLIALWPRTLRSLDRTAAIAVHPIAADPIAADPIDADPAERLIARIKARPITCPACGPRPEADALCCSDCGRYLIGACLRCGAAVESARAKFCEECGAPLVA